MLSRILTALDRFNRKHPWSHNDAYAAVVLRAARRVRKEGGSSALDVGCGTGHLVVRLSRVLPEVVGIDADYAAASLATAAVTDVPGARVVHAPFPLVGAANGAAAHGPSAANGDAAQGASAANGDAAPLVDRRFDLVSMVAVLHHLPLVDGLRSLRDVVAPGGRLVVVGCYEETRRDRYLSLLSLALNPIVGALTHPRRANGDPEHMTAPTTAPAEFFSQIKRAMEAELPGVVVHRALFWRYVATWTAPSAAH